MAKPLIQAVPPSLFDALKPQAQDPLLALMAEFRTDKREGKIDLGVGMYRDASGITPVMRAVKAAERILFETQTTKGYMGPEGDAVFVDLLKPIVFGDIFAKNDRVVGLQAPGGTGALRLGAELIAAVSPRAKVWLGEPTWPNHRPLLNAARLAVEGFKHFDRAAQTLLFDETMGALTKAAPGDVVLLQACCHNPTGADYTMDQWRAIAETLAARGLVPFFDFAYQGLGDGLDADAAGMRLVLDHVDEALVGYASDKNFGVYRERVGALYVVAGNARAANAAYTQALALARANWSMPSDHGAAAVRLVLQSPELRRDWSAELDTMRARVLANRARLAALNPRLSAVTRQRGMFSQLDVTPETVTQLKDTHGIYMVGSGRINVAGFRDDGEVVRFAEALASAG
ncbi:MAG: aspartate/tyrosine/aromatic aminotransferase [Alphaproteobacteria bacterium]|nr:aspartate/tyrosine/aromatic aminotransferase [Alphaproteobacteria bacterium]